MDHFNTNMSMVKSAGSAAAPGPEESLQLLKLFCSIPEFADRQRVLTKLKTYVQGLKNE